MRGLLRERHRLRETIRGLQSAGEAGRTIVGSSPAARRVRQQIEQAIAADCRTILITGETGTGKEVVARAIHFQACRETDPLIAVSCCRLSRNARRERAVRPMCKGAFTGATQDRVGYFELAHGSSLFLDEIGDLSPAAQAKMLRVYSKLRKLRRVGASEKIDVDLRVIVATNVSLDQLVESRQVPPRPSTTGLNVYTIELLPLRERREDILPPGRAVSGPIPGAAGQRLSMAFSPAIAGCDFSAYDYPGNAHELRNVIERAAILAPRRANSAREHLNLGAKRPSRRRPQPPTHGRFGLDDDERARDHAGPGTSPLEPPRRRRGTRHALLHAPLQAAEARHHKITAP